MPIELVEAPEQHQGPIAHLEVILLIIEPHQGLAVIDQEPLQEQRLQERLRIVIPEMDLVVVKVIVLGEVAALEVVEITEVHAAVVHETAEAQEVLVVAHEAAEA